MKRCVIVGGADINDYDKVRAILSPDDYYIFCDFGLRHADDLTVIPYLIIVDFYSYNRQETEIEMIVLPTVKDDTDTVYAAKEALKRGYKEFLLIGCVGQRLDHTLANVSILQMLDKNGAKGVIVDDYSEMELVKDEVVRIPSTFAYFSLINIYGNAKGITISGAKYPLSNAEITTDYQYGVSNEVVGNEALVSVQDGALLLIKVF